LAYSLSELATILGSVAIIICRYFDFDDLLPELSKLFSKEGIVEPVNQKSAENNG
jgi:hypothetical protein